MPEMLNGDTLPARNNGKHPGGRPTKRTPEIVERIAEAIADGLNDAFVCDLVGIDVQTLIDWRKIPQFSHAIKSAEAARLQIRLRRIESGGDGWQGTAWFVERKYPREWSRPELQVAMNVEHSGVIDHAVRMIPQAELLEMMRIAARVDAEIEGQIYLQDEAA